MYRSQWVYNRLRRFRAGIEAGISWLNPLRQSGGAHFTSPLLCLYASSHFWGPLYPSLDPVRGAIIESEFGAYPHYLFAEIKIYF
jgi:hypothetical protein